MKFYILDDLISSVKSLANIIESRNLGEVIGSSTNSEKGVTEILAKNPDIVLVDLLMPIKDGITVVNEVHDVNPDISFIMVSQVVDKNMISDAYNSGIEFFITKPNNRIEIENVIRRVIEKKQMETVLSGIRSVMGTSDNSPQSSSTIEKSSDEAMVKLKKILGSVGMLGESGTKDIINVCSMLIKTGSTYDNKTTLNTYAESLNEDPKIVKQRIRRAIKRGLTNVAALGIEDYYSDTFSEFAHTLYNFDTVRNEMDLLRGKTQYGGKPTIDGFFEGLESLCQDM